MPRSGTPVATPMTPTTANTKPTSWANFNGGTGSRSVTGLSRGATTAANTNPYGCRRGPRPAPIAKTTAWTPRITAAATGLRADAISVITSTAVVTQAANLGPRTSTWSGAAVVLIGLVLIDTETDSCCVGGAGGEHAETAAQS